MALPLDRFLNLTYFYATENAEEQEKNQFDIRLNVPDERARRSGRAVQEGSMWSKENEESSLSGFVASLAGRSA
jgi:hypothetical protein